MVFEHLKNQEAKAACLLPNVARYQLRHTPKKVQSVDEFYDGKVRERSLAGFPIIANVPLFVKRKMRGGGDFQCGLYAIGTYFSKTARVSGRSMILKRYFPLASRKTR